jgi:methyl-accepting chemotaxis protein
MSKKLRLRIGAKIYTIVALSVIGLLAVTYFTVNEMNASLHDQKRAELTYVTDIALSVVKDEYNAAQKGMITTEEAQKRAAARVAALRYGKGEYFWIVSTQERIVMHPTAPHLNGGDGGPPPGRNNVKTSVKMVKEAGSGYWSYSWPKPGGDKPMPKLSYAAGFQPWGWVMITGVYIDDLDTLAWNATLGALQVVLVVLLIAGAVSVLVARGIANAMKATTLAMRELAAGKLDVVLPGLGRGDEIGEIADAVEAFKVKALERARTEADERDAQHRAAAEQQRRLEEREAARQKVAEEEAAAERKAAMEMLAKEFESAVGNVIDTVTGAATQLEGAATTLTHTAEVTQTRSGAVAAASEQASANVQSVASATEELTSSVNEISRQVHESSRIAGEAVRQADKTNARIADLSQAAGRIGDVVKLITAVAEQTNLLALNATIEAARAGEAGKGFAVVAQEVKALAAQTAKATDEIRVQISGMQTATQESVSAIKEIATTIARIADIATSVTEAVETQGAATREIADNIQQAARGTMEVASNITEVNHGAAETGSASAQVLSSARSLAEESSALKREVARFLESVRAA